jgi:hypothetical protein
MQSFSGLFKFKPKKRKWKILGRMKNPLKRLLEQSHAKKRVLKTCGSILSWGLASCKLVGSSLLVGV